MSFQLLPDKRYMIKYPCFFGSFFIIIVIDSESFKLEFSSMDTHEIYLSGMGVQNFSISEKKREKPNYYHFCATFVPSPISLEVDTNELFVCLYVFGDIYRSSFEV